MFLYCIAATAKRPTSKRKGIPDSTVSRLDFQSVYICDSMPDLSMHSNVWSGGYGCCTSVSSSHCLPPYFTICTGRNFKSSTPSWCTNSDVLSSPGYPFVRWCDLMQLLTLSSGSHISSSLCC